MLAEMTAPTNQVQKQRSRAQRELARREAARRKLIPFACYIDPKQAANYQAAHLQLLAEKLEAVERGDILRLMVFMPNRHWKSSLTSQKFPAWFIGRRGSAGLPHQVMVISYGATLAEEIAAASRDVVKDNTQFGNVFPKIKISRMRQSAAAWGILDPETGNEETHPSCIAAGISGGITGKGADLIIIDDPVKNAEEAQSAAVQERNINAWTNDIRTRLNPGAAVVLVMTRWAEGDLAGRLLKKAQEDPLADQWEVLVLPALAYTPGEIEEARRLGIPVADEDPLGRQPGQALWPERYDEAWHMGTKANDEAAFFSIGQQMPRRPGGYLIGRQNFKRLPGIPDEGIIKWCIATDWAMTAKEQSPRGRDPDYTVAGLIGLWYPDPKVPLNVNLIIAAMKRDQLRVEEGKRMVKRFALDVAAKLRRRPTIVAAQDNIDAIALDGLRGDPDLLGWVIVNIARRMMRGDKVVKSEPWRSRAISGRVYVVDESWWGEPWHEPLFLESEGFPKAAHDDMIDDISVGWHFFAQAREKKAARSYSG